MERPNKRTIGLLSLLGLALALGLGVGVWGKTVALAASPSPTSQAANPAAPAGGKSTEDKLMDSFIANFTSRLGVDEAKLNTAFTGAVNATVDQAVRDGTLTQDQATQARNVAQKGFKSLLQHGFDSGDSGKAGVDQQTNPKSAVFAALNTLGISLDELRQGAEAGKSMADVARAHNVDAQTLKNAILNQYKTQLDALVRTGTLTQAKADEEYGGFSKSIDDIVNGNVKPGDRAGDKTPPDASTEAAEQAAWNAAASALGMQPPGMKQALMPGKTLTDLAREKSIDPQSLRTAMLHAGKASLDAAVTAKTLTQAQVDQRYNDLTTWVDTLMTKAPN